MTIDRNQTVVRCDECYEIIWDRGYFVSISEMHSNGNCKADSTLELQLCPPCVWKAKIFPQKRS